MFIFTFFLFIYGVYITYSCFDASKLNHYGEDGYSYAEVTVGSGKSGELYFGVIDETNYDKWINGDSGTLWLEHSVKKGYGNRISVDSIVTIAIHDKDHLYMNFYDRR
jgi:hypothetical protein